MYTINNDTKIKALIEALKQRESEVFNYQINIDNYRLAIEYVDESCGDSFAEFRDQLCKLLQTEIHEQGKANIMLKVVESQLSGEDINALLNAEPVVV